MKNLEKSHIDKITDEKGDIVADTNENQEILNKYWKI